jgi:hypothetical protein
VQGPGEETAGQRAAKVLPAVFGLLEGFTEVFARDAEARAARDTAPAPGSDPDFPEPSVMSYEWGPCPSICLPSQTLISGRASKPSFLPDLAKPDLCVVFRTLISPDLPNSRLSAAFEPLLPVQPSKPCFLPVVPSY